ncbi:unnamed protein product [Clonostachys rosea]|uniref:N-acetyltransferase domain-containing protein n=1 Tax=Bionectria ochroleuca TaxID=29856 RepID=A0ABY6UPZ6_BIOOC|nr:unnamed protein product [Clonostachys rosea]
MSLPTNPVKPAQSSIRSFFQPKAPKYAPPPSQAAAQVPPAEDSTETNGTVPEPAAPPRSQPPSTITAQQQPSDLPREANIRPITSADINALRRINSLLLQVPYSDQFYERAADEGGEGRFSRVITWTHEGEQPQVVGGVVCRTETPSIRSDDRTLYIQSLCLLSPYRSLGLITAAVNLIIEAAAAEPELNVKSMSAHVWTENEEGLQWYDSRGFKRDAEPVKGYYIKLRPDSAWFVRRDLTAIPASASANGGQRSVEASATAAVVNLPPMGGPPRPELANRTSSGQSFQNRRAETEWNDLPADMANGLVPPPRRGPPGTASGHSSRSSSTQRKKRDRSYPAAAFGS